MAELNFHHLRYFWVIAHERQLTRAAALLHVSPSALSVQLKQLEERLGHALFERRGRGLHLTEAGRLTLDHADTIFKTGQELVSTLAGRPSAQRPILRVGSAATLSRNFQLELLRPLLAVWPGLGASSVHAPMQPDQAQAQAQAQVQIKLQSGRLRELLLQLGAHTLDLVLANEAVPRDKAAGWHSVLIAQQPLSLVSRKPRGRGANTVLDFPRALHGQPLLLPGEHSAVRLAFDTLLDQAGVRPLILAEVDDMAMLRLLARETGALALVPPVVVQDELKAGLLVERCRIPALSERFYAISAQRRFAHPLVKSLLQRAATQF